MALYDMIVEKIFEKPEDPDGPEYPKKPRVTGGMIVLAIIGTFIVSAIARSIR